MNLLQIRTRVRYKLDSTSDVFWSDDELNSYVNEELFNLWQQLIENANRLAMKVAFLDLTANVREVPLPSDFLRAKILDHLYGEVYYPCTYFERFDTVESKNGLVGSAYTNYGSFAYSFLGSDIILNPPPQYSETGTLRLTYYYQPDELVNDTDVPPIPSIYHNLFVVSATIRAKEKEEMVTGKGADVAPFLVDYQRLLKAFLNNVAVLSDGRTYVEPFGV